ncbi:VOC family protein [Streptomyces sp. PT12]|uniref:bleomycin resistance protein n=1 Tax=Streptomyces sp. PT12 TaxID=1510197 RepID=UPI000DE3FF11|nr:VOC family protein [Streptomyces sp. PT12]RBM19730.1 glyoxalase/bleomycin resistance/extradiol dioxygenase family protein [Streptomyces sp. PT12]
MTEKTIPLLSCPAIQPVVDFYTALGFEVTFLQRSPYAYAVVERGDVELQFHGMKELDPEESLGGCYILTDEVDALHEAFRAGLREAYGRVPTRGIPRIGPVRDMSYGVRQFLMTDPGGNSIRVGQPTGGDSAHPPAPRETFARALHFAVTFADSKEDPEAAAKILDRVLAVRGEKPTDEQLLRILVLRGDIAHRLGHPDQARDLIDRAAAIPLAPGQRAALADDLARLGEVREALAGEGV